MASDLAAKAKEAFIDDHFELTVDLYSQAILVDPHNPDLFSDRAQANIKLCNFTEAVADASKAMELDPSIPKAYLRKGTACFSLEEYQTAKTTFEAGSNLAPGDTRFTDWIKKCDKCIVEEFGELPTQSSDATPTNVAASPTTKDVDEVKNVSSEVVTTTAINILEEFGELPTQSSDATPTNVAASSTTKDVEEVKNVSSEVVTTPAKPKYRHKFYQKPDEIVVIIFAKGIPASSVSVSYGEQILSVTIDVPGEDPYIFQPRLFGKIVPTKCRYDVLSTKVKIWLAKAETIHWLSLEFVDSSLVVRQSIVSKATQRPAYPSSKPTKDWGILEAQVEREEKDEKLDGDAALQKFFRDIYKDADQDTRRAMQKSFIYTLKDVSSATNNFSHENLIMEGALGKVYKGQGLFYDDVIVQRLDCKYGQGDELQTEISIIKSLEHKNIARFCTHFDENNEKIIIYEAFRGTLNQHLRDPNLTWSLRLQICLGVARALNHVHYDIIHCDVNSSKIILDKDWEPKIYGFELSTKYPQSWRHRFLFSRYFNTNNLTPKYDVYCFGVLLLEVLCGRKPLITNDGVQEELDEIIDPNLRKQIDTQTLTHFINLASNCTNQQPVQRPTMDQIVKELEEVLEIQWKRVDLEYSKAADEGTASNSLKIPLREIKRATNSFNKACFVGSGGYAEVYKAELDFFNIEGLSSMEGKSKDKRLKIRKTVAIKRITNGADKQAKQGFLTEIQLLSSCKHPNIVSLLGFCDEAGEMILVYEFAFKGSLADYLISSDTVILTWTQRIKICLNIAEGIKYLHTDMEGKPRIIHRDIKSDNILFDEKMNAKLADFGLSKSHHMNQQPSTIYSKNIAGTPFYIDPEYYATGKHKRESDIYSFGVVLFEILSGRVAYDSVYTKEDDFGLAPIARRRFSEGTLKELIDPKIIEEDDGDIFTFNRRPNQDSFHTFSKIAYQCLAETQVKRPTIDVVIKELQNALELQGETVVLSRFRLSDIVLATENFAETYCIGIDTIGIVYKAELDHFGNNNSLATEGEPSKSCITVAIKHITSKEGGQGKQEFFEEIEMRTGYKHPNIVSLLGFCDEGDKLILVYEPVSGRNLDDHLKSVDKMDTFTWTKRLHACLDIAHALNHLHTNIVNLQRIIQTEITSANIMLDKNWEAKIGYLVNSKLHPSNQEIGVKVYKDPKYQTTRELKREFDVYSYGVVLLEILCGRVAYDPVYIKENDKGLAPIACKRYNDGTIHRIMDPSLKEGMGKDILASPNEKSLNTFLKIAFQCLGEASKRPTMELVIEELKSALRFQDALKNFQISLENIESATKNFSEENCVGSGTFWKAYKGELSFPQDNANTSGRTTIVAKRWDSKFAQADQQFQTEFNILFKCYHENVIHCEGYCNERDEKIIAYEHMSNGSLDKYLEDANLTWMKRLEICIDVAKGLEFLHQGGVKLKKVVHGDIKCSSILLRDDWRAKISNLEFSSLDMEHVSEKSDIYSFGVVLLEILCGSLSWVEDCEDHPKSLGPLAKRWYKEGKLDERVFEGIKEQIGPQSLSTFAHIATQCLHDNGDDRPTASEVVTQLKKALDVQFEEKKYDKTILYMFCSGDKKILPNK